MSSTPRAGSECGIFIACRSPGSYNKPVGACGLIAAFGLDMFDPTRRWNAYCLNTGNTSTRLCKGMLGMIKRLHVHICPFVFLVGVSAYAEMLMVQVLKFLDPLPSRLLRTVVDEMVDTEWIAKSTYFLIPLCESRCGIHLVGTCPPTLVGKTPVVLSASARLSCGQLSMGSLTGFSLPYQLLCCNWHRSGHAVAWMDASVFCDLSCQLWFEYLRNPLLS
jgi:hypothetical protein